jgi:sterol desaturase/sphingolipid hydroxylase (fatty acid hydroxylase superfamily)
MDPTLTPPRRRARLPAAWVVLLWLTGGTSAFIGLAWWLRAGSVETMVAELGRRVRDLDGTPALEYFLLLGGILALEMAVLGWERSSIARLMRASRSARADLLLGAVHALGWAPLLMTFASAGWIWAIERVAGRYVGLDLLAGVGPAWLQLLIVFLLVDLLNYWSHRLTHDVDFLWESHRYHHAATEFTILTGHREHALDEAFQHFVIAIPLAILGTPVSHYIGVRLAIYFVDILQHSMVPWTYGWVGRWVIFSPVGHRIHHSPRADQHTSNYGNLLVIWDRIFGTWYAGNDVNEMIGLPDNPYNRKGVVVEYLHTIARSVRVLKRSLSTGRWRTGPGTAAE